MCLPSCGAGHRNAVPPTVVHPCITNVYFSEDFKVGQNVAQYWNDVAPEVQWRRVINSWYDEVGDWSSADTPKFRYTSSSPGRSCRPTQTHTHLILYMNSRFPRHCVLNVTPCSLALANTSWGHAGFIFRVKLKGATLLQTALSTKFRITFLSQLRTELNSQW